MLLGLMPFMLLPGNLSRRSLVCQSVGGVCVGLSELLAWRNSRRGQLCSVEFHVAAELGHGCLWRRRWEWEAARR